MRLLKKGNFMLEKVKYEFLLETDGHKLFFALKANNKMINITQIAPELRRKLGEKIGSYVVDNLVRFPWFITCQSRTEYSIPYPENSIILIWYRQLEESGFLILESKDYLSFQNFLFFNELKVIETIYMGKHHIFSSPAESKLFMKKLYEEINKKKEEIRDIQNVMYDLDVSESKFNRSI